MTMRNIILTVIVLLGVFPGLTLAEDALIKIGVLSHRGDEVTLSQWSGTAEYLSASLDGYRFVIVPLKFEDVDPAVAAGDVDFVLVNPGIYVNLEVKHRVSRIATLNNQRRGVPYNVFGGVIFTRADSHSPKTLDEIRGTSFMAVNKTSLGGFHMAWRELKAHGIEVQRDLGSLSFAGTHDKVVMAVREGRVQVGTVRTDILERMADDGTIDLAEFRILGSRSKDDFPFVHSTQLYPEWPFSKVRHTSNTLAQKVAVALLNMPPDHPAAVSGKYAGWTIPLDYQPVHELFKELKLPPYDAPIRFTLGDVAKRYSHWILLTLLIVVSMLFLSSWVLRLNRELKKAQSFLERKHDLILNSVADGIYGVDMHGNSTFVNRAMERITGWQADELIGMNQHDLLHHTRIDGSVFPGVDCPVYHTFRDNMPRYVGDDIFWRKDGTSFPVEYSSTPVKDEAARVVGAVVVFRDITERKAAEEKARQHQAEFAHIARLSTMGEMAAGIAHEINQPLSAIANYTQGCIRMLKSGTGSVSELIQAMERAALQANRAGEIIRQLRHFIRKEQPQRSIVDLNEIAREVAVLIESEARRSGVQLRLDLMPSIDSVLAHNIQLEQVILNLARNAIEAMAEADSPRRELTIRTRQEQNDQITVSVSDTGPGLSPELMDQVFDQFFTTKPRGMGLGLSISRGIIEAHDGQLTVSSNAGATFSFVLAAYKGNDEHD